MEQRFNVGVKVRIRDGGHVGIVRSIYENIRHIFFKVEYADEVTGEVHIRYFFADDLEEFRDHLGRPDPRD